MADRVGLLASGLSGLTGGLLTGFELADRREDRLAKRALAALQARRLLAELAEREGFAGDVGTLMNLAARPPAEEPGERTLGASPAALGPPPSAAPAPSAEPLPIRLAQQSPAAYARLIRSEAGRQALTDVEKADRAARVARARTDVGKIKPRLEEAWRAGDRALALQLEGEAKIGIAGISGDEAARKDGEADLRKAMEVRAEDAKHKEDAEKTSAWMKDLVSCQDRHRDTGTSESFEHLIGCASTPVPKSAEDFRQRTLGALKRPGALAESQVELMDRLVVGELQGLVKPGEGLDDEARAKAYQAAFAKRRDLVPAYLTQRVYDPAAKPTDALLKAVGFGPALKVPDPKDVKSDLDLSRAIVLGELAEQGQRTGLTLEQAVRQAGPAAINKRIAVQLTELRRPEGRANALQKSVDNLDKRINTLNAEKRTLREWMEKDRFLGLRESDQEKVQAKARVKQIDGALPDLQRQLNDAAAELEKETGRKAGQVPVAPPPAAERPKPAEVVAQVRARLDALAQREAGQAFDALARSDPKRAQAVLDTVNQQLTDEEKRAYREARQPAPAR